MNIHLHVYGFSQSCKTEPEHKKIKNKKLVHLKKNKYRQIFNRIAFNFCLKQTTTTSCNQPTSTFSFVRGTKIDYQSDE